MLTWIVVVLVVVALVALAWWTSGPRYDKRRGQKRVDGTDSMSHPVNKYGTGGGSAGIG
jgi:hypothetical protein